ncbi:MAG: (deoxy)nucleoside triphosphate pyrophosphohydrolase [Candidatus Desulfofervidaceae bacterium]|nr:(deoxy)nucleoside triphosphate pyrophosphohydrolase [Candidatus Desulfofervidaceae bacterium]
MKHYEVTAAVIRYKEKVLVTSRPDEDPYAGLWEFPGGKREENEVLETCLLREIKEELGIDISIDQFFTQVCHTYPQFSVTLYVFLCSYQGGKISPLPTVKYRWVDLEELQRLPLLEADKKIVAALLNRFKNQSGERWQGEP